MERGIFIIAEAGVNHNGDVANAIRMIEVAKEAGADAVKFQTFKAEKLLTAAAPKADYQKKAIGADGNQLEMIKGLEIAAKDHSRLIERCREVKVKFLSSPFDLESISLLDSLGLDIFKIPSGEITNLPYLRKIGSLGKRIILSTGMSTLGEIEAALDVLEKAGANRRDITVLHCNTDYPSAFEDVNLRAMLTIKEAFKVKVGYSDHTEGIEVPIAAAALGAAVIEKHFTLDRGMKGPDHMASLDPPSLHRMVEAIRKIETAMGDGVKRPTESERMNVKAARKAIVALRPIREGEFFTAENISVKRPAEGISPMEWDRVIGRRAMKGFQPDEPIEI